MSDVIREKELFRESKPKIRLSGVRHVIKRNTDHRLVGTFWKNTNLQYLEKGKVPSDQVRWAMAYERDLTISEAAIIADLLNVDLWVLLMED